MTPRRDLAAATYAAERAIDTASRDMQGRIGKAVRQHEGPMTQEARRAILKATDEALSRWYPSRRGAPSRLQAIIERHARAAMLKPVADAVGEMRAKVPAEIVAVMEVGTK